MATPLIKAITNLNQKHAELVHPSYIQWNPTQNVWFVEKTGFSKPFEYLNWHRLYVLGYFLWFAVSGVYLWLVMASYPGILDIQDLALVSLVGFTVIPLLLLFEYGYMSYAVELCGFINWGNKKQEELLTFEGPSGSSIRGLLRIIFAGNLPVKIKVVRF